MASRKWSPEKRKRQSDKMKAKWAVWRGEFYADEDAFCDRIRDLSRRGCDLSSSTMQFNEPYLLYLGVKWFGSWRVAIEACGIEYKSVCKAK